MNIFYLDENIEKCAQYHFDTHVIKMILESAQILCTVMHMKGIKAPYMPTHMKHPCVIWAAESMQNWLWLQRLTVALDVEYRYRWKRVKSHKSAIIAGNLYLPEGCISSLGITERPQAMPDKYKVEGDAVAAYRKYYLEEKKSLYRYTRRVPPLWWPCDTVVDVVGSGDVLSLKKDEIILK